MEISRKHAYGQNRDRAGDGARPTPTFGTPQVICSRLRVRISPPPLPTRKSAPRALQKYDGLWPVTTALAEILICGVCGIVRATSASFHEQIVNKARYRALVWLAKETAFLSERMLLRI